MDMQSFFIYIPFEINDIIKAKGYVNKYKIKDIQHIYSCKNKNVVKVIFVLEDIDLKTEVTMFYKDHEWEMVKRNDE